MRPHLMRLGGWCLLAGLCVLAVACAPVYLNPGPNPARIEVELTAKVDPALLQHPGEVVYWDWGLNLVVPSGPLPLLQPTEPQDFKVIFKVNPLVRKVTFLAPYGQRSYLLQVTGYVFRTRGDSVAPITLLAYNQKLDLNLRPGETYRIQRNLNSDR